jgi:transcriptional regulator with XRE-family HTH domain
MTPFGEHLRKLRQERGVTLKEMANAIGISPAYLSALEHGKRGQPSWPMQQRIVGFLNIIWDDAEELQRLAQLSDPKVSINTSDLSSQATLAANLLGKHIAGLNDHDLRSIQDIIEKSLTSKNGS